MTVEGAGKRYYHDSSRWGSEGRTKLVNRK